MGKRVLVVAEEVGLRATLARALQLAGYDVELAEDFNRALALTTRGKIAAAIVAQGLAQLTPREPGSCAPSFRE